MNRLPMVKARDVMRVLRILGFEATRQVGAHVFFKHTDGRMTTVPVHGGSDIGRGLLRKIVKDIRITPEKFMEYL